MSKANSILLTLSGQAAKTTILFTSTVALGRLLDPRSFGIVAMAAPVVAFSLLLQDLGLSQALIQTKKLNQRLVSTLFYTSLVFNVFLAFLSFSASPALSRFFGEPDVQPLNEALALLIVLNGSAAIPSSLLQRSGAFGRLVLADIAGAFSGLAASLVMSFWFRNFWVIYAGLAINSIVQVAVLWQSASWLPGRPAPLSQAASLLRFGADVTLFNLLNFVSRNSDNVLIGWRWGGLQLGLYDRAYKLLMLPLTQLNAPLARVMIPILSRELEDPVSYRASYLRCVGSLMWAVQPGILVLACFPSEVLSIALGSKWIEAAPILVWLAVAGLHQVFTSTMGWLFITQARTRPYVVIGAFGSTTTLAAIFIGLHWGPAGVAAAYCISEYALRLPFVWYLATRSGAVTQDDVLGVAWPFVVAGTISAVLLVTLKVLAISIPPLLALPTAAAISYIAFTGALVLVSQWHAPTRALITRNLRLAGSVLFSGQINASRT